MRLSSANTAPLRQDEKWATCPRTPGGFRRPSSSRATTVVGLVADTHGLLRPELLEAFAGVDLIVHAGDVGKEAVLEGLKALAPTVAVRGNVDRGAWAEELPKSDVIDVAGVGIYIQHGHEGLDLDAVATCRVVVSGHSHRLSIKERGGVLYLNPGSAGPRRFKLPVTAMRLAVRGGAVSAERVDLQAGKP